MSRCNWLDSETLGSQLIKPKNLLGHCKAYLRQPSQEMKSLCVQHNPMSLYKCCCCCRCRNSGSEQYCNIHVGDSAWDNPMSLYTWCCCCCCRNSGSEQFNCKIHIGDSAWDNLMNLYKWCCCCCCCCCRDSGSQHRKIHVGDSARGWGSVGGGGEALLATRSCAGVHHGRDAWRQGWPHHRRRWSCAGKQVQNFIINSWFPTTKVYTGGCCLGTLLNWTLAHSKLRNMNLRNVTPPLVY